MKTKTIILLAAMLSFQCTFAQFAKIVDKDGYVNLRKEADVKSEIVGKINSDEILYIFSPEDSKSWLNADYTNRNGKTLSGYIHSSRIKYIESYESVPAVSMNENKVVFNSKNITVIIESEPFNYAQNKKYFSITDHNGYKVEDKFKGQQIWGTDGTIPQTHYKLITVKTGGKTLQISPKEVENLFNINTESATCYFDSEHETLYINMVNSDGAGGYAVLFTIAKGVYKGKNLIMPF
ncbi:SH3 domain-containing protein [Chryseobacterium sp. L7]|uniref:SH3 domain-containing protein n=1 Tax=Chryseobacterium endalhagicum TaxID=2797638 RepID=A0ABS1QCY1_9FLAO|nr:SH3 domain-containing protein [Chryseobacterium endalhagicum]MBL1220157.1 SH3 domain-containing protein [Chryseobacterium endalhagicum]